jgi:hypothetical protein
MSVEEPVDKGLGRSVCIAWALIALSILVPIFSLILPYPPLAGIDAGDWFSRSGAVTTVFALLAEAELIRARLSITPGTFSDEGLDAKRRKYLPKLRYPDRLVFWLVIFGTLVWGYGDLTFKFYGK